MHASYPVSTMHHMRRCATQPLLMLDFVCAAAHQAYNGLALLNTEPILHVFRGWGVTTECMGDGWCAMVWYATRATKTSKLFVGVTDMTASKLNLVPYNFVKMRRDDDEAIISANKATLASIQVLLANTTALATANAYQVAASKRPRSGGGAPKKGGGKEGNQRKKWMGGTDINATELPLSTPDQRSTRLRKSVRHQAGSGGDTASMVDLLSESEQPRSEDEEEVSRKSNFATLTTKATRATLMAQIIEMGGTVKAGEKRPSLLQKVAALSAAAVAPAEAPAAAQPLSATSLSTVSTLLKEMQEQHAARMLNMQQSFDKQQSELQRSLANMSKNFEVSQVTQQEKHLQQANVHAQLDDRLQELQQLQQQQSLQQQEELKKLLQEHCSGQLVAGNAAPTTSNVHIGAMLTSAQTAALAPATAAHQVASDSDENQPPLQMPNFPYQMQALPMPHPQQPYLPMPPPQQPYLQMPPPQQPYNHNPACSHGPMVPQLSAPHLLQMYAQAQAEAQESSREARVRANALAMRLGFMM